eukprot:scaffold244866_cov17-Prasinocladus_malaysianus.AAC.2
MDDLMSRDGVTQRPGVLRTFGAACKANDDQANDDQACLGLMRTGLDYYADDFKYMSGMNVHLRCSSQYYVLSPRRLRHSTAQIVPLGGTATTSSVSEWTTT